MVERSNWEINAEAFEKDYKEGLLKEGTFVYYHEGKLIATADTRGEARKAARDVGISGGILQEVVPMETVHFSASLTEQVKRRR